MMEIKKNIFGKLKDGTVIEKVELRNNIKLSICILTYGGIIQSIETPDIDGVVKDIVLGYDTIEDYVNDPYYFGAIIGPVAGRIASAKFPLNGKIIQLESNQGQNHLHGGNAGLNKKTWTIIDTEIREESVKIVLRTEAKDGEAGYPGNREFKTTYILNNKNQLSIYFDAISDKDTIINMTSHSYFNLSDKENDTIYDHKAMLHSLKTLSMDEKLIPNGGLEYVLGKSTNFSRGALIGHALSKLPKGIDHVYVINKEIGKFGISAKAVHEISGRTMELVTDQPAVVFYTSNFLDGSIKGKGGNPIIKHGAFCFEPQQYPDAPNQPNFPSIIIKAGEIYKSRNQFAFGLTTDQYH